VRAFFLGGTSWDMNTTEAINKLNEMLIISNLLKKQIIKLPLVDHTNPTETITKRRITCPDTIRVKKHSSVAITRGNTQ